jgi:hypothetical protein
MGSQGDFSSLAHNKKASYAICCENRSKISVSTGKEPKRWTQQVTFLIGILKFPGLGHAISTVTRFF